MKGMKNLFGKGNTTLNVSTLRLLLNVNLKEKDNMDGKCLPIKNTLPLTWCLYFKLVYTLNVPGQISKQTDPNVLPE